jgi:NAD(P)-dependent dehydrogenase (short-subunit alcohol dehydrogenase family)
MMSDEFEGKSVWVIGASGALGGAVATAFLQRGATVFLSARNEGALKEIAEASPHKAHILPVDIGSEENVKAAVASIIDRVGRIDVLVNSTSVSTFKDFIELDDAAWRQVFEAKLFAYVRTMRVALPHMRKQKSGVIINVSGTSGKHPAFESHIAGGAGNAAVNLMSKAVANIYGAENIRINCIAPGPIQSARWSSLSSSLNSTGAGEGRSPGTREDIAEAAIFLASERAKHIQGVVLTVDGGMTPTI